MDTTTRLPIVLKLQVVLGQVAPASARTEVPIRLIRVTTHPTQARIRLIRVTTIQPQNAPSNRVAPGQIMPVNVRGREQEALTLPTRQGHTKLTRQLSVPSNRVAPGQVLAANVQGLPPLHRRLQPQNLRLCQLFRGQRLRAEHFRFSFAIFSPYLVSNSCAKLKL